MTIERAKRLEQFLPPVFTSGNATNGANYATWYSALLNTSHLLVLLRMTAGKNAKVKASGLTGAAVSPFGPGTPGRPGEPCKKQEKDRKIHESTVSTLADQSNCPAVID